MVFADMPTNDVAIRQRQVLLADIESHFNPSPPPEPTITDVVVVEEDQGPPKLGYPNLHRWF
jgi:hypothetical protein